MPQSFPELAIELINLIIDQLHDSRPDLKTCALVHRDWLPQSRYHLFHDIRLFQNDVAPFLELCSSPYSTLPLAHVQTFGLATNLVLKGEPKDKTTYNCPALDQLLTWQSPETERKLITERVFGYLRALSLSWIGWWTLSDNAKAVLHGGFTSLTELKLWNVVFGFEDEFVELLGALHGLQKLRLDGVVLREARDIDVKQRKNPPQSLHTIDVDMPRSEKCLRIIEFMRPCPSLKSFSGRVVQFSDITTEFAQAMTKLLESAGSSLENFSFAVKQSASGKGDMDLGNYLATTRLSLPLTFFAFLDAVLQQIDLSTNVNLQSIYLSIEDSSYLLPFLRRLINNSNPSSLKKLHVPNFLSSARDSTDLVDQLFQHPYFSSLQEFRCTVCVPFGLKDVKGQPKGWYDRLNEGSQPLADMAAKIDELKLRLPSLNNRGVLRVDEHFCEEESDVTMLLNGKANQMTMTHDEEEEERSRGYEFESNEVQSENSESEPRVAVLD
ncbi:hypothetical protein D9758_013269 [Tetrapyrgos nigripes]|uniref:Uncharacterized protein n=1 Tax=Tetrapyrgos nigripes TaxID=182062 RepID=A0A8H5CM62_9AGAR|nr:hypothetical protein D9758_013269 [Tetrapyrgos nigripes]